MTIDEICVGHITGASKKEPIPEYMKEMQNGCYGCIPDEYNKHCPRYVGLRRWRLNVEE